MPYNRPRMGVVGDDISGVVAVAGELSALGYRTVIADRAPPDADAWAINTAARELGAEENHTRTQHAINALAKWGADDILIKIDSLWRGHPAAMLAAVATSGIPVVLVGGCPPETVADVSANISPVKSRVDEDRLISGEVIGLLPKASPLIRRFHQAGVRRWVGGMDLAEAIAVSRACPAPVLTVLGTRHPNNRQQLDFMLSLGAEQVAFDDDIEKTAAVVQAAWRRTNRVILTGAEGTHGLDNARAAEQLFAGMGKVVGLALPPDAAGLILSGGHTAECVLRALEITSLVPQMPGPLPGAPLCRAGGGTFDGLRVVTKPGHFGQADSLQRIADYVAALKEN